MYRLRRRLLVALWGPVGLLAALVATPVQAAAGPLPDATWVTLGALPERLDAPVFALGAGAGPGVVLAGTGAGSIFRSDDHGATWKAAAHDLGRGVVAIAANPVRTGEVLAGTRGGGAWRSEDDGVTWSAVPGAEGRTVRGFAFVKGGTFAATDRGVVALREVGGVGASLPPPALDQLDVAALAAPAINAPARLVAGGDLGSGGGPAIFASADGGATWAPLKGPGGSSSPATLAAGGVLPTGTRPLLLGTSSGFFVSTDNAGSWSQLSGTGSLPGGGFTLAAFAPGRADRFYAGGDGGGTGRGGLWGTADSGAHFSSLQSPLPGVTALAVALEDVPVVYIAAYRGADHAVMLFALRDTGSAPKPPVGGIPAPAAAASPSAAPLAPESGQWLAGLAHGPEAPYLLIALAAVLVLLVALVSYVRRGRRR